MIKQIIRKMCAALIIGSMLIAVGCSKKEEPVISESELSEDEREFYAKILKYWKPVDELTYYDENSHIPTVDSSVKGVKYNSMEKGMYIYTFENEEEGGDILQCYVLSVLHAYEGNSLDSYDDYPVIVVDGKKVCMIGFGNDSKLGRFMAVGFLR